MAEPTGGGGSPTPIPLVYPTIRLAIEPGLHAVPTVRWYSEDDSIVVTRPRDPYVGTFHFVNDAAASPSPDPLQTVLLPAPVGTLSRDGTSRGVTHIVAEIGAPVYERVAIPVYATGSDRTWRPPVEQRYIHLDITPLPPR